MNYLAHLYLAGDNELNIVGNFLGDFIKGNVESHPLDQKIIEGIKQHRLIDQLADQKIIELLNAEKVIFKHRRYSGIVFDIANDHFLAKHWQLFSNEGKGVFIENRLNTLQQHKHLYGNEALAVLNRMEKHRWLENYQDMAFIEQVFYGIHKRFKRENRLDKAFVDFENNYTVIETACLEFTGKLAGEMLP